MEDKAANSLFLPLWWSLQPLPAGARCFSEKNRFSTGLCLPASEAKPSTSALRCESVIPVASPVGEEEIAAASGVMTNNWVALTAYSSAAIC